MIQLESYFSIEKYWKTRMYGPAFQALLNRNGNYVTAEIVK